MKLNKYSFLASKSLSLLVITVSITFSCLLFFVFFYSLYSKNNPNFEHISKNILQHCKDSRLRNLCYENSLVDLVKTYPMEEIFSLNRKIQLVDPISGYCHSLSHKVVAEEIKKNPDDWQNVLLRCPTDQCGNGCIHGAFQERFNKEFLSDSEINEKFPEFKSLCNNQKLSFNATTDCYHALGHLFFYITGGRAEKSLQLCSAAGQGKTSSLMLKPCTEGVFMQIYQPQGIEDQNLIKNLVITNAEEVKNFCSQFKGLSYQSCWNQSWPVFGDQITNPAGLIEICNLTGITETDPCYSSLLTIVAVKIPDAAGIKIFCDELISLTPDTDLDLKCYSRIASRILEIDRLYLNKAVEICNLANNEGRDFCFDKLITVVSRGNYSFGKSCDIFPDPWKYKCKEYPQNV